MFFNDVQFLKAPDFILTNDPGKSIDTNSLQDSKALLPIVFKEDVSTKVNLCNFLQFAKELTPIFSVEYPMTTSDNLLQPSNE